MSDLYDLAPLQDWYLAAKPNLRHACEEMGYLRAGKQGLRPDTSRLLRALGLKTEGSGRAARTTTSFERAAMLARTLGADLHDVGL